MRVAVLGANGQLGTDVVRVFQETGAYEVLPLTHSDIEVTDAGSVRAVLLNLRPQTVVNCAAFHRVDECEERPDEAFKVNALGALFVARACAELDALCVYVSTDYVFDGSKGKPYTEEDTPTPINVYGVSKLSGELLVKEASQRWIIARVASLFGRAGARGKGGNFVEAILGKARSGETPRVIDDIWMSPTYTYDASRTIEELVRGSATGTYHLANLGSCTWYEFAARAVELCGVDVRVEAISSREYPSKAKRPRNSSLRSLRTPSSASPWTEALKAYLAEKRHLGA